MTAIEGLQTALNGLGLKAIEARLENLLEQASKKEPSYADFLQDLLSCEVDARRTRYLRARLALSHCAGEERRGRSSCRIKTK